MNKAGLVDILGDAGTINVQGEDVKKLEEEYLKVVGGKKEWLCLKNRFFAAIPKESIRDRLLFRSLCRALQLHPAT